MLKLKSEDLIYLSDAIVKTLTQNRITTVVEFLQEDISKLATITRLNLPQILAVRSEIFSKYSAPVINGSVLLENLSKSRFLSTGIERLDAFLGGGIPRGCITELCGLADSGKTQLCFQLAINCTRSSNSTVLYVDTKGDFSAVRIQKILDSSGFSHKDMASIMCKIQVAHVWTMDELIELLQNIKHRRIEFKDLALIIIDSLPCLMLQFLGDDNKIGLKFLNNFVNYSRYLAKELQIGLVCVNIQTRWVDQEIIDLEDDGENSLPKETFSERRNRCLGRYWQHIPYLVLLVEKTQNNTVESGSQIIITMLNEDKHCNLNINALGVT